MKVPQRLKGFNDFFIEDMKIREYVIDIFKEIYEKYGYEPLETPALEFTELMLGQSGEEAEKLYYRFNDQGGRDVMLKYEVMISMCRALSQNINNIVFPYKRYQIQSVWRAENVQKGRYREFTQCDADIIGSSSVYCDAEIIQMGVEIVKKLGFKEFKARINNRKFLEGLAEYLKIDKDKFYGFSMSIDKLEKIGIDAVIEEMVEKRGIESSVAQEAMNLITSTQGWSFNDKLGKYYDTVGSNLIGKEGLDELKQINEFLESAGVEAQYYEFDTSIARGLASYTGPVWEFTVIEGGVGSISGAGRYDNAIEKYIGKKLPATGGSFGIERVCDILKARNMIKETKTVVSCMIANFDENLMKEYIKVGSMLRNANINTMIFPDAVKLEKQFKYADKKNIKYVLLMGENESKENKVTLRNMLTGEQKLYNIEETIKVLIDDSSDNI
ncbi:histidine--tRNA ligase [Candidatus Dojkabacteria bacterium]|nr:histidine--tRNA ligase [Candidatus Dojkabacteria bacterium]